MAVEVGMAAVTICPHNSLVLTRVGEMLCPIDVDKVCTTHHARGMGV